MENIIEKPMLVMQIRPEFSIVYKANPKLKLKKHHLKTKKDFTEYLSKTTRTWKEGEYFLRSPIGPFAGFQVKKGGKIILFKENKNKVPYLCWTMLGGK